MCFSLQASLSASAVLAVCGLLSLRKAQTVAAKLLAATPLFFALQQLFEGMVWWTLNKGDNSSLFHITAVYGFLSFASVFWPLYIPLSLYFLEPQRWRRPLLLITAFLGSIMAIGCVASWIMYGIQAVVTHHHIAYVPKISNSYIDTWYDIGMFFYAIATIGSAFISSMMYMWLFGLLSLIGFVIARLFYLASFGSIWCFFAAINSIVIYFIVDRYNKIHQKNKNSEPKW